MNVNPKTVRRVMVLIAGAVLLVAALGGVYVVRQRQIAAKYAGYREAGMAAFAAEDYVAALRHLKHYISKHRTDRDALFAYATARSRVEEPDGKHLSEGIKAFQMLRDLEPDSNRVRHALLEQYTKAYYHTEAIELADKVLAGDGDDVQALWAKALALKRLRKFDEATAVSERLNDVAPQNLEGQLLTYGLYQNTKKPAKEVIARAEAMRDAHPGDPRFELLVAIAYGQSGDAERARDMLRAAAARTPPDPQFVRQLSMVLDRNRMFADSQKLLERAAAAPGADPQILGVLVQRLWQNGYVKEAADRLKDLDPASPSSDSQLLALRALSLYHLDQRDEARRIVDALAARAGDGKAQAWATALATRFASPQPEPRAAIAQYRAALTRDPDNGVIRYMVGEAYERLGESEPALAAWRLAAELVPSWSKPAEKMARALAATGRTEEAVAQATAAMRTTPHELGPAVTYVVVAFKHLGPSNDGARVDELLKVCEAIRKVSPGEPETLPIYVALLARKGQREEAITAARAAISAEKKPSAMTLLRLASASRAEKLGLESEIMALVAKSDEPLTPTLALARASELAAAGKAADGLKLLADHAAKDGGNRAGQWLLAVAQYREQTKDPKAADAWLALGDAHPHDIAVQTAILRNAPSVRGNRPFIERTIDRVKNLTGEEGTLWKIERARWLLGSDREKDHSDAVNTLGDLVRASPTLIEPRMLLAAALEKIDNESGAIKELRVAADLEPRSSAIALELARLLQAQGKFDDAQAYLDRVARGESLDPATRRNVAAMLAQQGDFARATTLLKTGAQQNGLDDAGMLLLAELHRRQGQAAEADAVYQALLARPAVDLATVESAADFYASQGKLEHARAVLAQLEAVTNAPPGARELVRARFAERHETPDAAAAHYAAATKAAPADATTWRNRIGHLMRLRRPGDAVAVADEALAALPGNASLQSLKAYAVAGASAAGGQADLQPLIDDLAKDPANARATKTAQLLQEEAAGKLTKADAAARFRQLADQFPRHKPLQFEAVRRALTAGDVRRAAEVAARTMSAFPADPDAARLAAQVYREARDWKQMEYAAQQWRTRSLDRPADADAAIAEARLAQGDAAGAVKQLAPHAQAAAASPDAHGALLVTYGRALAAAGREAEARTLLEPLLPTSELWRGAWMSIAQQNVTDAGAAVSWLDHVAPRVMTGTEAERMALARAWLAVGSRWQEPRAHEAAKKILLPLASETNPSADALLLLASAQQASNELPAAEANYRKALAIRPDSTAALNNLAYLLLAAGGDLAEAQALSTRAVAQSPDVASFHDTLARIRNKAGDRKGALESFQRALDIEPDYIDAMIGKASVLAALGERAALNQLLQQIDAALPRKPNLSAELKRELETARTTASAAADPR